MRILIAEDDTASRFILEAAVRQLGHEPLVAADGEQAWQLYQTSHVDAVISDRTMPRLDGLGLCRRIRESEGGAYVYFIFLTSLGDQAAAADGMHIGADDYLSKPFDARELSSRLAVASRITALYKDLTAQRSELEVLNRQLFEQARLDGLTQVGNRVKLRDDLDAIALRVANHGASYCAIMCDVDHFKLYNDTYGHLGGDDVLRAVARTLVESGRPNDQVYRYGGEEFLIVVADEQLDGGFECAERHRAAIERLSIPHSASSRGTVTISAGVATFARQDRGALKEWLERADGALYRAKQMGRNRVLAAEGTERSAEGLGKATQVASTGTRDHTPQAAPLSSLFAADFLGTAADALDRVLQVIRSHLGMDVAFVSEFTGDRRIFRHVDASPGAPLQVGDSHPLEDSYCQRVVDGRLPELIPDTSAVPEAMALPVTTAVPVGAHLSVPIRLRDGSVYGTFCAFSFSPDHSLNERDLDMMRAFADLASYQIERRLEANKGHDATVRVIQGVIEESQFAIGYQPIYRLDSKQIVGFECLSRFSALPSRSPDLWFAEAASVGLGVELELTAIKVALDGLSSFPDNVYLAVNISFATIISPAFLSAIGDVPAGRLMLEITEHDSISEYDRLSQILEPLRRKGMRVAVDDAGAGYCSFRHILQIKPDLIKLDRSLVQEIDTDPARRALASALVEFARATGSQVIAEGVETASELIAVRLLGADKAQGYFLGRPMPLAHAAGLFVKSEAA